MASVQARAYNGERGGGEVLEGFEFEMNYYTGHVRRRRKKENKGGEEERRRRKKKNNKEEDKEKKK